MLTCNRQVGMTHGWRASVSDFAHYRRALGLLLIPALLLGEASSIRPAAAQTPCGDRAEVLERLDSVYEEHPEAIGLTADGRLLEVLVSPKGSWTILVTDGNYVSCLVASGESWESEWAVTKGIDVSKR